MQVVSHMAFAAGVGSLAGLGPHELAALTAGSAFPDAMDSILAGGNRSVWCSLHRTVSHWPVLYPVALAGLVFSGISVPESIHLYLCMFLTGALIHISCDFLTPMGIPLYPPFTKRVSLNLIRTGSILDYVVGFLPAMIYGLVWSQQWG